MSKINLDYVNKYNVSLGWGYYFEYDVFKQKIEPYLEEVIKVINYDYISVIREGVFNFCHYGPSNIKEINTSTFKEKDCNLTLCEGIYCYNSDTHKPVKCKKGTSIYYGTYIGKYIECVVDCEGDGFNDKATGNLKEYVLLSNSPVKFEREVMF